MSLIKVENISKFYKSGDGVSVGIQNVSASFNVGEFVGITGESGSGKTTLINVLSGLDKYEDGELYINEEETSHFTKKEWETYRSKYVGFIFQNYNIIDSYTVYQNVILALEVENYPKKLRHKRALELIERVGLTKHRHQKAIKLSGGEKQRTVIARALAKNSPVIIADEPTGNLDKESSENIIELLYEISKEKLIIIVTHDFDQIEKYATRKIKMHDGGILEDKVLKKTTETIETLEIDKTKMSFLSIVKMAFRNILAMPGRFTFFIILQILIVLLFSYVYLNLMTLARSDLFNFGGIYTQDVNFGIYYKRVPSNRMFIVKKDFSDFNASDYNEIESLGLENTFIYKDITFMDNYYFYNMYYWDNGSKIYLDDDFLFDSTYTLFNNESFMIQKGYQSLSNLASNEIIVSNSFGDLKLNDKVSLSYVEDLEEEVVFEYIDDTIIMWEESPKNVNFYAIKVTFEDSTTTEVSSWFWETTYDLSLIERPGLNIDNVKVFVNYEYTNTDDFFVKGIYNDNYRNTIYLPHDFLSSEEYSKGLTLVSKTEASAIKAFNNLDKTKYRVIYPEYESDPLSNIFGPINFILSIVFYALIFGMGLFLYFLLFLVLRNVMETRRKDFAIFRSIGAHQTNLGWLVIFEQLILTSISFIVSIAIFYGMSKANYYLYQLLDNIKTIDYIIVFVTLTYLSTWLARRFNKKTFNLSIIENITESKELEL